MVFNSTLCSLFYRNRSSKYDQKVVNCWKVLPRNENMRSMTKNSRNVSTLTRLRVKYSVLSSFSILYQLLTHFFFFFFLSEI